MSTSMYSIIESQPQLPPKLENKVSTGRTVGGSEGEVFQGSVLQCGVYTASVRTACSGVGSGAAL